MSNQLFKKFAEELKHARDIKGISLQQIATKTRIDLKYIRAIEEGNFDIMPDVYIRAFVKEFAQCVDLNVEATLARFSKLKSGIADVQITGTQSGEIDSNKNEEPIKKQELFNDDLVQNHEINKNKKNNNYTVVYYIAGAFCLMIVAYFIFFNNGETEIIKETPYSEIVEDNSPRYEKPVEPVQQQPEIATIPSDSLRLTIKCINNCWVGVKIDDSINLDFTLTPGKNKIIAAKQNFNVIIGNGAAVEFYMNNKKLEYIGKPGMRETIKIGAGGIIK